MVLWWRKHKKRKTLLLAINDFIMKTFGDIPPVKFVSTIETLFNSITDAILIDKFTCILNCMYENCTYEDRVKLSKTIANIMENDEDRAKQILNWINNISELKKLNYYANLFRCAILNEMSEEVLSKLISILESYTYYELTYLKENFGYNDYKRLNVYFSYLYMSGLFVREREDDFVIYKLSGFGKILKRCSLNYEEKTTGIPVPTKFDELGICSSVIEPMTNNDIRVVIDHNNMALPGKKTSPRS